MKELDKLVEGWRADGIRLNGGADKPYTDDENSIRAFVLEHCADELEAALKQSAVGERVDLEQFRPAVECWVMLRRNALSEKLAFRLDVPAAQKDLENAERLITLIDGAKADSTHTHTHRK